MIKKLSLAALAAATALFVVTAAAGSDGADGSTYVLTSFDGATLLGLNDQGRMFEALLGVDTVFKPAKVEKYQPTDPCREAAVTFNSIQSFDGYASVLTTLVANGCKARVLLDTRSLPPSPIRSFRPTA